MEQADFSACLFVENQATGCANWKLAQEGEQIFKIEPLK